MYDVIVVGAGHAGCEAAAAAANLGSQVLLITTNMDQMAYMSCNPAMGGVAKGQIVREIDAMGGYSGIVTDRTMIQFRMLNRSKGPAMWSPRAQSDLRYFSYTWRTLLENIPNVYFRQDTVNALWMENDKIQGVQTLSGAQIRGRAVILTNGTFLNGIIHIGEKSFPGGRIGDSAVTGITEHLKSLGFTSARLKTGTPVRVDGRSIDFTKLVEQKGDENPAKFSFLDTPKLENQLSCYLCYTDEKVHDTLRTGFDRSPMYSGRIQGTGPRYCPSIEDKIHRFADKTRHQLFVEPQGRDTHEYYINGFSSSLPEEIQYAALRQIKGFEQARIFRPGYAIEYDYFPPTQLRASLETKYVENLYFAGQINGTTGYEEAASQGFMAGINANLKLKEQDAFILKRSEAYIGVLIDDLVTKGVDEPYRMFTSRAEYRILLRQDNADKRLTPLSYHLGLANEARMRRLEAKNNAAEHILSYIKKEKVQALDVNPILLQKETATISQKTPLINLAQRPQVSLKDLCEGLTSFKEFVHPYSQLSYYDEIMEEVEIIVKYSSYIEKEEATAERIAKYEDMLLYEDFDYKALHSLSFEAREKLTKIRPRTLGQASRISGVSPADISVLIIYLSKGRGEEKINQKV
ncbi:MAG: tRNA uridine-5-carboxymethylaminomethyl(34) synthesis enzyme MnmG [Bacteroidales bacterium]